MISTIHVFVGPTLPPAEVGRILPRAIVHPPIKGGDLLRLEPEAGDVVAIIDGYFHTQPAVRHKEILYLLDHGVRVVGGASLGALRAAELWPFGMEGVGTIFRCYRAGLVDGDDEVAVLHADAESSYLKLTEALIDLRFTCRSARRAGRISRETEQLVVAAAGRLPFTDRTRQNIRVAAGDAGVSPSDLDALGAIPWRDVKREDAIRVLRTAGRPGSVRPFPGRRAHTHFFERWRQEARANRTGDLGTGGLDGLVAFQLFGADYPAFQRRLAVAHVAAQWMAGTAPDVGTTGPGGRTGGPICGNPWPEFSSDPQLAAAARVLQASGIVGEEGIPLLWASSWLSAAERGLPADQQLAVILGRCSAFNSPRHRVSALLSLGRLGDGIELAARVRAFEGRLRTAFPTFNYSSASADRIKAWFASRWGAGDWRLALRDRGFRREDEFLEQARLYYPMARLAGGNLGLRVNSADDLLAAAF